MKEKYHTDIETNFLESGKESIEYPDIDLEEEIPDTIKLINAVPDSLKEEVKELKLNEDE